MDVVAARSAPVNPWLPRAAAGALAFALLAAIQLKVARPMLLAERFLPGAGWVEAALLSAYAGWLAGTLVGARRTGPWRRRLWTLFSIVFFSQLALGLAGFERFLMTGKLHLPVPAMFVAGPLYRGEGLFMPILFLVTVLIVGPGWCSFLCYVGSWDFNASLSQRKAQDLPKWRHAARLGIFALVVATALALRALGAPGSLAAMFGLAFGLGGVAVMVLASRRLGSMAHCVIWCPIGLLATTLGRLSPFRLRIESTCEGCNACGPSCRYDALQPIHISRRKVGLSCTLCGDCLSSCGRRSLTYGFPGLSASAARAAYFVLVASLHAVFLGVARI